ncbi:MAG: indolepyruvate oxidoreductase subunit beta [Candidatus Thorarchaeota archaeon]
MTPRSRVRLPTNRPFNLIVAGVGGQGILLAARVIAQAAIHEGFTVSVGETFGASRRGGTVLSHIRFTNPQKKGVSSRKSTNTGSLVPHYMVDALVGLEPLEALRAAHFLNPDSQVLLNEHLQPPVDVIANKAIVPSFNEIQSRLSNLVSKLWMVDALALASKAGEIRTANMVMIGALAGLQITPISQTAFVASLQTQFEHKDIRTMNQKAFQIGVDFFS